MNVQAMTTLAIEQEMQDIEVIFDIFGRQYLNEEGEQRYAALSQELKVRREHNE